MRRFRGRADRAARNHVGPDRIGRGRGQDVAAAVEQPDSGTGSRHARESWADTSVTSSPGVPPSSAGNSMGGLGVPSVVVLAKGTIKTCPVARVPLRDFPNWRAPSLPWTSTV